MIAELRQAVISAIYDAFGGVDVYGEQIKQGFQEPCFFVQVMESRTIKEVSNRYSQSIPVDVQYFADTNRELLDVIAKLIECLEYITLQENLIIRGFNISYKVEDGVLHFFITYKFHMLKRQMVQPDMKQLQREEELKNGSQDKDK